MSWKEENSYLSLPFISLFSSLLKNKTQENTKPNFISFLIKKLTHSLTQKPPSPTPTLVNQSPRFPRMFLGHMDGMQRAGSSKELLLSNPVSERDADENGEISRQLLYIASFEEFASSVVMYDTIIWVSISLLLVLAWGVGIIMLLYLPMRRYVLSKDLSSRKLYVTPSEVVYKVLRPSYIPFWGFVKVERRIPLALAIDIIIEQGVLQAMFGIHTFRLESVAQGKASYVDELQIQGVSNPQLLRKVIVKEASKIIIQDAGRPRRALVHGTEPQSQVQTRSFAEGSNVSRSPRSWKAMISPRPTLAEQRGLIRTDILINKMDEVSKSVKKLERIVEKGQPTNGND